MTSEKQLEEWNKARTFIIRVFFAGAAVLVAYGIWVGTIQNKISTIQRDAEKAEARNALVENRLGALEVNNGEIRARLTSIEATLQEIKLAIIKLSQ